MLNQNNISIRQFAKDLDLDYSYAHNLVNREDLSETRLGIIIRVAKYLEVNIEQLFK